MIDLNKIAPDQIKTDMPVFNPGDHIRVQVRVIEGDKERLQSFEGDVKSIRGAGLNKTFMVRKMFSGVGVERIFPFNSVGLQNQTQGNGQDFNGTLFQKL